MGELRGGRDGGVPGVSMKPGQAGAGTDRQGDFGEGRLTPLDPVAFSGFVDPGRIAVLIAALSEMGLPFTIEFEFEDTRGRNHLYRCAEPPSC